MCLSNKYFFYLLERKIPVMIRTRRTLTRNGRKKALKILDILKNVRSSRREHVFKHISFVNKLLQDLYFIEHKMTGDDMFKLLHEILGEQDMFLLKHTWTVVQNCQRFKNLDGIKVYSKLVKSFVTSYKNMVNAGPNSSSLARRLLKVTSTDKVRKVKDENLELVSESVLKQYQGE